ncbi:MAG: undecaprenyl-diphosphate phosphatase [Candidatus Omnitrophica bacterium]|nr:undecaprenyl-diphosphate phosphatase [Candidatus Omnitrophota bacterium]
MVSILQAVILGIVQGFTEFLPVSSSGHLVFLQSIFGLKEPPIFLDCMLHGGTLVAILVYFRKDILLIISDLFSSARDLSRGIDPRKTLSSHPYAQFALLVILAMVPTVIIGYFLRDFFVSLFGSIRAVGIAWLINGVVLWLTSKASRNQVPGTESVNPVPGTCAVGGKKGITGIKVLDAVIIGTAQGAAIAPGISRSGTTISSALFRGIGEEWAVKFSLFLAIPAILAGIVLEARGFLVNPDVSWMAVAVGTLIAAAAGYLAIHFLMRITRRGVFFRFAYYSWAIGVAAIIVSLVN